MPMTTPAELKAFELWNKGRELNTSVGGRNDPTWCADQIILLAKQIETERLKCAMG